MNEAYPQIRISMMVEDESIIILQCGVAITFFMRSAQREIASALEKAVALYCEAVGGDALGYFLDELGDWRPLDERGWECSRREAFRSDGGYAELRGRNDFQGYSISLRIPDSEVLTRESPTKWPDATSAVSFRLPMDFLISHGPERVRALAMELGVLLPFNSGHAGLSFQFSGWTAHNTPTMRERMARHPGVDVPDFGHLSLYLGTRVRSPYWLTFLGQPVLGELGGVDGLQARLRSPGTTVQEMSGDRAVISLGPEPEAGDLEQGLTLPHYRELAQVLEPWLYLHDGPCGNLTREEIRRWERRFLEPIPTVP